MKLFLVSIETIASNYVPECEHCLFLVRASSEEDAFAKLRNNEEWKDAVYYVAMDLDYGEETKAVQDRFLKQNITNEAFKKRVDIREVGLKDVSRIW